MSADETSADAPPDLAPRTREAWKLVRTMLDDLTGIIEADAADELELVEGFRLLARLSARCTHTALDADPDRPRFIVDDLDTAVPPTAQGSADTDHGRATTATTVHAGTDPNVVTHRAAIDGRRRYRIRGRLGSTITLSFTVLAGRGLAPRRAAGSLHAHELAVLPDGAFEIVLAQREPPPQERQAAVWLQLPDDASDLVVRQHVADASNEQLATLAITPIDRPAPPSVPSDHAIADRLTVLAWAIARLATRHRVLDADLLACPNELSLPEPQAARADDGSGARTPTGEASMVEHQAIGAFELDHDEALVIDLVPPDARWWSVTLENVWRESCDGTSAHASLTCATAARRLDNDRVRVVVAARDPGVPATSWLDTGGRARGFVVLRWLDAAAAPLVATRVVALADVARLDRDGAPSDA